MGYAGDPNGAIVLDGRKSYLGGFLPLSDTLAVSFWMMPMPNFNRAVLLDYGMGQFTVGIDAVTSATWPLYKIYYEQDTAIHRWNQEVDYFFWHHLYVEIGDTLNPPGFFSMDIRLSQLISPGLCTHWLIFFMLAATIMLI